MEKGVLKYGEYDGEQSEPIRVDRDRESQTRVKKHAEKAEKIRVSTLYRTRQLWLRRVPRGEDARIAHFFRLYGIRSARNPAARPLALASSHDAPQRRRVEACST